jgi:hypothetical protein
MDELDGRRSGEAKREQLLAEATRPRQGPIHAGMRLGVTLAAAAVLSGCATYATRPPAPTVSDVVALAQAGAPPEDIIRRMQESRAVYDLSASQLADLRAQGVPSAVIDYMQATQLAYAQQQGYASGAAWGYGYPGYGPYWGYSPWRPWGPGWGYSTFGFGYYSRPGYGYRHPGFAPSRPPGSGLGGMSGPRPGGSGVTGRGFGGMGGTGAAPAGPRGLGGMGGRR